MSSETGVPETVAERETASGPHPGTARLLAYYRGETSEAEASLVVEHLSLCQQCTQELLELVEFLDGESDTLEDPEEAEVLRRLEESLRTATAGDKALPAPRPIHRMPTPPRRPVWQTLRFAYSLAAALALALGLSLWRTTMTPPSTQRGAPRVNVEIYDLKSTESERSEDSQEVYRIRWDADTSSVVLILNPAQTPSAGASFGAVLRGTENEVAWQSAEVVLSERRTFQIGIDRGMVRAGRYALEVFERTAGHERKLGTYLLQIDE